MSKRRWSLPSFQGGYVPIRDFKPVRETPVRCPFQIGRPLRQRRSSGCPDESVLPHPFPYAEHRLAFVEGVEVHADPAQRTVSRCEKSCELGRERAAAEIDNVQSVSRGQVGHRVLDKLVAKIELTDPIPGQVKERHPLVVVIRGFTLLKFAQFRQRAFDAPPRFVSSEFLAQALDFFVGDLLDDMRQHVYIQHGACNGRWARTGSLIIDRMALPHPWRQGAAAGGRRPSRRAGADFRRRREARPCYAPGTCRSGMGGAAKRRWAGLAIRRAQRVERETRALSVDRPVLANICR